MQNPEQARRWNGLRQDSGDPFAYAPRAKAVYEQLGIDPRTKMIIFSDALNVDKALRLKQQCDELGVGGLDEDWGCRGELVKALSLASASQAHPAHP